LALAFVRGDAFDRGDEPLVRGAIDGTMPSESARGILAEEVVALPVRCGPDRPRREAAAAIGTNVLEHGRHASCAERALVAADARLDRIRRQRLVAVFAGWPELEHAGCLYIDSRSIALARRARGGTGGRARRSSRRSLRGRGTRRP